MCSTTHGNHTCDKHADCGSTFTMRQLAHNVNISARYKQTQVLSSAKLPHLYLQHIHPYPTWNDASMTHTSSCPHACSCCHCCCCCCCCCCCPWPCPPQMASAVHERGSQLIAPVLGPPCLASMLELGLPVGQTARAIPRRPCMSQTGPHSHCRASTRVPQCMSQTTHTRGY